MCVQCRTRRIQTDMLGNESPTPSACGVYDFGTLCCFIAVMALATEFAIERGGVIGLANGLLVVLLGFRVTKYSTGCGLSLTHKTFTDIFGFSWSACASQVLRQQPAPQPRQTLKHIKSFPRRESRRMPDQRPNAVMFVDSAKARLYA